MTQPNYLEITRNGLWSNNPGLVQLLGLCPLLAISNTVINALGLGLATTLTLVASNVSISLIRNLARSEIRIPIFVLIIAAIVTAIEMTMKAFFHELYLILGIFIPLIVTNCNVIGRAEAFASKIVRWPPPSTAWRWGWASPWCWWLWAPSAKRPAWARCSRRPT